MHFLANLVTIIASYALGHNSYPLNGPMHLLANLVTIIASYGLGHDGYIIRTTDKTQQIS